MYQTLNVTPEELDHIFLALLSHSGALADDYKIMVKTEENYNYTNRQFEINGRLAKMIAAVKNKE